MSRRREINYRKAPVAEPDETVGKKAFSVRSPVSEGIGHTPQYDRRDRLTVQVEDSRYTTHELN